jgi:hypothetical protein
MTHLNERITQQLLRATLSRFEMQRQEALAVLDLYLHSAVGIGDHSNIVSELAAATTNLSSAEEAIGALQRNFLSALSADEGQPDDE